MSDQPASAAFMVNAFGRPPEIEVFEPSHPDERQQQGAEQPGDSLREAGIRDHEVADRQEPRQVGDECRFRQKAPQDGTVSLHETSLQHGTGFVRCNVRICRCPRSLMPMAVTPGRNEPVHVLVP